jgi:hypothetical protein
VFVSGSARFEIGLLSEPIVGATESWKEVLGSAIRSAIANVNASTYSPIKFNV